MKMWVGGGIGGCRILSLSKEETGKEGVSITILANFAGIGMSGGEMGCELPSIVKLVKSEKGGGGVAGKS